MPDRLLQQRQLQNRSFEPAQEYQRAYLTKVDGSVRVANRPGYVWVRDVLGSVRQVFNPVVSDTANLPVKLALIRSQSDEWMVLDVDWQNLKLSPEYDGSPFLKNHATDHEWRGGFPGPDALTFYPQAFAPLRTSPYAGLRLYVAGWFYFNADTPTLFAGGIYDMSGYQPAAGLARMVGVYLHKVTNTIGFVSGDTMVANPLVLPPLPARPPGVIMSAYVRLAGEQTTITWRDIMNARQLLNDRDAAGLADTDDLPEGATNLYYTEARVAANSEVAANSAARHTHPNQSVLDATSASFTTADETKLDGIESGATADQSDVEIETAYNNRVAVVSQAEAEAGVATTVRRWTAERVAQAIAALSGSGIVVDTYWAIYAGVYTIKSASEVSFTKACPGGEYPHLRGGTIATPGLCTFDVAVAQGATSGVRLPTLDELQKDLVAGTGGGYDSQVCWTCTPVANRPGYVYANYGTLTNQVDPPLELNTASDTAYTRYVANVSVPTYDHRYFTETEADARFLGISAKAADSNLLDGIDSTRFIFGDNLRGTTLVTDFDAIRKSGFYNGNSATGSPAAGWYHLVHHQYINNDLYAWQLAKSLFNDTDIYIRRLHNGVWYSWSRLWNETNIAQLVTSLNTQGGVDADFLQGAYASESSFPNTIPIRKSNGQLQVGSIEAVSEVEVGYLPRIVVSENGVHKYITAATLYSALSSGGDLNAMTLDDAPPDTAATPDTVALRNANGHLYATYFNTTNANDVGAVLPAWVYVSGTSGTDKFIRKQSPDNLFRQMGLRLKTYTEFTYTGSTVEITSTSRSLFWSVNSPALSSGDVLRVVANGFAYTQRANSNLTQSIVESQVSGEGTYREIGRAFNYAGSNSSYIGAVGKYGQDQFFSGLSGVQTFSLYGKVVYGTSSEKIAFNPEYQNYIRLEVWR